MGFNSAFKGLIQIVQFKATALFTWVCVSSLAQKTTSSGPHKNGQTILFLKLVWHFITQYIMHTHSYICLKQS